MRRRGSGALPALALGLALGMGPAAAGQTLQPTPAIHTVFIIVMENMEWSEVKGSPQAPFINQTLLPAAAHAEEYMGEPYLHPSLPNYLSIEAGTNFGITDDLPPSAHAQNTSQHLTAAMSAAGLSWKAWVEDISGEDCPVQVEGLYSYAVNPTVYFDDTINDSGTCIAHERPIGELAAALANNTAPNLNWIIPNLCDDAHSCPLSTGDQWLSQVVGMIEASKAYQNGGAIFLTWDETEDGVEDQPLGLIVASPAAKPGYAGYVSYTHASLLRTIEEIFQLSPYFGAAAQATDLSDLFNTSGLALSPGSLSFAPQALGTMSAPLTVGLSNTGSVAIHINGVSASGTFSQTNDCPAELAAGASCAIAVQFTPQGLGRETGKLQVDDDAPGSPQEVRLSGEGLGGSAELSATRLDFGQTPVGMASPPQTLSLTNNGTAGLVLNLIAASAPFQESDTCPKTLGAAASCAVTVRFLPTAAETSQGQLTFNDNAADSPQQVKLSGAGQGAIALVSAEALNWASQTVGTTSTAQTVTLQNGGNIPLALNGLAVHGPFHLQSDCGTALAPGAQCGLEVAFAPSAPGAASGTLTISDNAPGSPQVVDLNGTGMGPIAQASASQVSFGVQLVGTQSAPATLSLSNTGNAPLTLGSAQASGGFSASPNCAAPLPPGGSCTIGIQFAPTQAGAASGVLRLVDNAGEQTVALSGTGGDLNLAPGSGGDWSVASGQSASGGIVLTSVDGYADADIAVNCTQAPAPATCAVLPEKVALAANGQAQVNVVIYTQSGSGPPWWELLGAGLGLGLGLNVRRRKRRRRGLALAWLAGLALGLAGCGGLPPPPRVAPGAYTLQVVATTSLGVSRTLPLAVKVR